MVNELDAGVVEVPGVDGFKDLLDKGLDDVNTWEFNSLQKLLFLRTVDDEKIVHSHIITSNVQLQTVFKLVVILKPRGRKSV